MAIYIPLRKLSEDADLVVYEFGRDDSWLGKIRLFKSTGKMELFDETPDATEFEWMRAFRKIQMHHEKGKYPDVTCWAA